MSTKIINVEHDDNLDEIFEFLKKDEDEFILVVPKSHKVFKDPNAVIAVKAEADKNNKSLTVVSTDETIITNAEAAKFQTVGGFKKKPTSPSQRKNQARSQHASSDQRNTPVQINAPIQPHDEPEHVQEKGPHTGDSTHPIQDIVAVSDDETPVPVSSASEKKESVPVHYFEPENPKSVAPESEDRSAALSEFYGKGRKKRSFTAFSKNALSRIRSSPHNPFLKRKKIMLMLLAAGGILGISVLSALLSKATIEINAQKEPFVVEGTVAIAEGIENVDSEQNLIPGKFIEIERVLSENFLATGESFTETKARGTITIYNEFSSAPQVLVATTRFETGDGLIFRIPNTITVPGAKLESGTLVPGEIEVEVIADGTGDSYNIAPTSFTIPGFKGSPKYEKFYARSESTFEGGFKGTSKVATEEDIERAQSELKKKLDELLGSEIMNFSTTDDDVILAELIDKSISFSNKSHAAGHPGTEFTLIGFGTASTVMFNRNALHAFVQDKLKESNPDLELQTEITYDFSDLRFFETQKRINGTLNASGDAFYTLDPETVVHNISGLDASSVKDYFGGRKEVESANILISPFWKNDIPEEREKIKLEIKYE